MLPLEEGLEMSLTVKKIHGREVLDSRGNPTLEAEIWFTDGGWGRAMVPSGASRGEREVLEKRDGGTRFLGKGVMTAVKCLEDVIGPAIVGRSFADVFEFDSALLDLDSSAQKEKLGGNTILGASLAFAHGAADSLKTPLYRLIGDWMGVDEKKRTMPVPLMNVLNGGEHANNSLEIQEFMIVPHGFGSFSQALRCGAEIFQTLKKRLAAANHSTAVGDEGGFAPELASNEEALNFLCESVQESGYQLGSEVSLALDVAASSFYEGGQYKIRLGDGAKDVGPEDLLEFYQSLVKKYPIVSIEDGIDENDWEGWRAMTAALGDRVQLVGDDLFVTQKRFVKEGIELNAGNAVLVKVNQVGSLSETIDTMKTANQSNFRCVVSHRSGETEDTTIAHLAVGSGCGQIKTGSLSRAERTAKYNELLRINEQNLNLSYVSPFKGDR